jgi:hypothetical protein
VIHPGDVIVMDGDQQMTRKLKSVGGRAVSDCSWHDVVFLAHASQPSTTGVDQGALKRAMTSVLKSFDALVYDIFQLGTSSIHCVLDGIPDPLKSTTKSTRTKSVLQRCLFVCSFGWLVDDLLVCLFVLFVLLVLFV